MLSIRQMDLFFRAVCALNSYSAEISSTTLKATRHDTIATPKSYKGDSVGQFVVKKEGMTEKLIALRSYVEEMRPEAEKTIAAAVAGMTGGAVVKIELALRMHYLSGRDWKEIADLFKTDAAQLKNKALQHLEKI